VTWGSTVNPDSGWASAHPTRYTAQTPAYYDLEAAIGFASDSVFYVRQAYFQVTTGASNPGGGGNTTQFGGKCLQPDGSNESILTIAQLSPYLYLGDYLEVYVYQDSSAGLNLSTGTQWFVTLASLGP
jgi:hypothetical protein